MNCQVFLLLLLKCIYFFPTLLPASQFPWQVSSCAYRTFVQLSDRPSFPPIVHSALSYSHWNSLLPSESVTSLLQSLQSLATPSPQNNPGYLVWFPKPLIPWPLPLGCTLLQAHWATFPDPHYSTSPVGPHIPTKKLGGLFQPSKFCQVQILNAVAAPRIDIHGSFNHKDVIF